MKVTEWTLLIQQMGLKEGAMLIQDMDLKKGEIFQLKSGAKMRYEGSVKRNGKIYDKLVPVKD